jgi:hypothetical protein
MSLKQLSNFQLYEIIQNPRIDKSIKAFAKQEFDLRELTNEEIEEITGQHNAVYPSRKTEPLNIGYKILAMLIPFFWVIHVVITSRYPSRGQKRKWNEYWLFFCIGLLLWTIGFVIFARLTIKQG